MACSRLWSCEAWDNLKLHLTAAVLHVAGKPHCSLFPCTVGQLGHARLKIASHLAAKQLGLVRKQTGRHRAHFLMHAMLCSPSGSWLQMTDSPDQAQAEMGTCWTDCMADCWPCSEPSASCSFLRRPSMFADPFTSWAAVSVLSGSGSRMVSTLL